MEAEVMKVKRLILIGSTILLALAFAAPSSVLAAEKVIEIKAATWHPVPHRLTEDAFKLYGKEIEKRTNGRVKFKWFLGGSLVKASNSYEGLRTGLVDWVVLGTFTTMNKFPITEGLGLPFVVDSARHAAAVGWEMYKTIPEMQEEYSQIKLLGVCSTAIMNLALKKGPPPENLKDMKGLKVAAITGPSIEMLKLLGAAPRFIKPMDSYVSLQRGVVDGGLWPDAPLRSYRLIEYTKYYTRAGFIVGPMGYGMNMDKWKQLPPDIQKVFEDLSESAGCLAGTTLTNESKWVVDALKKRGDTFYDVTPEEKAKWVKKVEPMYGKWIEKLNAKGWNGQAIFDKMMAISERLRNSPCQSSDWWGRSGVK